MLWKFHFVFAFVHWTSDEKQFLVTTNVPSFIHFNLIHFCFSKFTPKPFSILFRSSGGQKWWCMSFDIITNAYHIHEINSTKQPLHFHSHTFLFAMWENLRFRWVPIVRRIRNHLMKLLNETKIRAPEKTTKSFQHEQHY